MAETKLYRGNIPAAYPFFDLFFTARLLAAIGGASGEDDFLRRALPSLGPVEDAMESNELTFRNILTQLALACPEVQADLDAETKLYRGDIPPAYPFFDLFFVPRLVEALANPRPSDDFLERAFAFLEAAAEVRFSEPDVSNLIALSVVDDLLDNPSILPRAFTYMGPEMRGLFDDVERARKR